MSTELNRIKNDLETIQKALGLAPAMGRDWIQWMKRDQWFSLWWCLPGVILIAAALLPFDRAQTHWGLVADQWAGILVAAALLGLAAGHSRHVNARDGRPEAMIREARRNFGMTGQGLCFNLALLLQLLVYFLWGRHYHVAFGAFWSGLFLLMGSTCLVGAIAANGRILLGYAVPFLAYGLCLPLAEGRHKVNGVLFGLMFIGVALSFSAIQVWQIRRAGREAR